VESRQPLGSPIQSDASDEHSAWMARTLAACAARSRAQHHHASHGVASEALHARGAAADVAAEAESTAWMDKTLAACLVRPPGELRHGARLQRGG